MKRIKRLLCMFMGIMLVVHTYYFAHADSISFNNAAEELYKNEEAARKTSEEYSNILHYYANGLEFSDTSIAYPDYYAGAYVNDDVELTVNVTYLNENIQKELINASGNPYLVINEVDYSFSDLLRTHDKIETLLREGEELTVESGKVFGVGLSIRHNAVNIYAISDGIVNGIPLSSVLDENDTRTRIIYRDSLDENTATVYPGKAIKNSYSGTTYHRSVGFWGYDSNGNIGFVTAPHNTMQYNATVNIGNNTFGNCNTPYYSGSTDAVFVRRTNTVFKPSNYISQLSTTIISHAYQSLPEGQWVRSRGKNTTSGGTVQDISYTTSYGISDTVLTSAIAVSGDSGGVVVGPDATSGNAFLVGIITGRIISNSSMIYIKAYNIFTTLGLSINNTPY